MNYEKKYKEALERARKLYEQGTITESLCYVFPELKESEDERIRKDIIWCLKHSGIKESNPINPHVTTITKDAITWLEEQGEQKPIIEMKSAEESLGIDSETYNKIVDECIYGDGDNKPAWSEEDKQYFNFLEKLLNNLQVRSTENEIKKGTNSNSEYYFKVIQCLKSFKDRVQPKHREWTDEDTTMAHTIISDGVRGVGLDRKQVEWLESLNEILRPNHWKPSDEQMDVIEAVINNRSFQRRHLDSLYEQLKKLKEE